MLVWWLDNQTRTFVVGLGIAGSTVAITGWLDDHKEIPPIIRIILYTSASLWMVFWLDGFTTLHIKDSIYHIGIAGNLLAILFLTWLINLYNFMDGTDGLAATEAVTVAVVGFLFYWTSGEYIIALLCVVIFSASFGFLIWNWSPAKIFMGDGGSCLLGITFGSIALYGDKSGKVSVFVWFILLALFIADSTFTLIKRILSGEKWYRAHNSHSYQKLVHMGLSHDKVAIVVLFINMLVLAPISYLLFSGKGNIGLTLILVYFFLWVIWYYIQCRVKVIKL